MPMNRLRVPWIEVLIVLAICLTMARYIWARELLSFENRLFQSWGIDPSVKYFFTVPVFLLVIYFYYRRDVGELAGTGRPVVRKRVFAFAGTCLLLVFLYLQFFVRGSHA